MSAKPIQMLAIATGLAMVGCANSTPNAREAAMPSESATSDSARMQPVKQWPLKFHSHNFSLVAYDVYDPTVDYAGTVHGRHSEGLQRSSASYGPDYQRNWGGGHLGIRNFPPPAKISWRSKDGQAHKAEIDFGKIFADEIIRHNVSREDMASVPNGELQDDPSIVLEVNDRTIRVWMRAMIFLKKRVEVAGVMRADFRNDLVLVEAYTY